MLVSQVSGHNVVSVSTAETVARVDQFLVDPGTRSIVAVTVKKAASGSVLRWTDLTAMGPDAVTVSGPDRITGPDDRLTRLADKHRRPIGKRVLDAGGDELGEVSDIDFDPHTGAVQALLVNDQRVAGDRLIGIGSWAVVVAVAEDEPAPL
ncbi:MAG: PRC-barrel domain-containing protein [Gordonia polyisoprenivorans]|nr:PRC-barrel domain-containing protein [Gordonia polyisoprenivorans]